MDYAVIYLDTLYNASLSLGLKANILAVPIYRLQVRSLMHEAMTAQAPLNALGCLALQPALDGGLVGLTLHVPASKCCLPHHAPKQLDGLSLTAAALLCRIPRKQV